MAPVTRLHGRADRDDAESGQMEWNFPSRELPKITRLGAEGDKSSRVNFRSVQEGLSTYDGANGRCVVCNYPLVLRHHLTHGLAGRKHLSQCGSYLSDVTYKGTIK